MKLGQQPYFLSLFQVDGIRLWGKGRLGEKPYLYFPKKTNTNTTL